MKLTLNDVWVKLNDVDVLRGVVLETSDTTSVGLIGRNGAGKTTLLRAIIGAVKPYRGSILLNKNGGPPIDLLKLKPYQIANIGVGYVPQGRMIFPDLTVEDNLTVAAARSASSDLIEWIYTIFPELRRLRDRRGLYLSGGEQQMLAIARALIRKPKILLLDEPFEGLAPKVVARLMNSLKEVKSAGVSMLITESGQLNRIKPLIDLVYGLDRGEIVYSGEPDGILKDALARQRIWGI